MQGFQPSPDDRIFCGGGEAAVPGSGAECRRLVGYTAAAVHQPEPVNCPRCDSTNTKFCYYNNYNLSQPRHFCKSCRRYWTRGGVLRNVPVGGGSRKSKRPSAAYSSSKPHAAAADKNHNRRLRPSSSSSPASRRSSHSSCLTSAAAATTRFLDPTLLNSQISFSNPSPPFEPSLPADPDHLCPAPDIFQDLAAGSFAAAAAILEFDFADPLSAREKAAAEGSWPGFVDQTAAMYPRPDGVGDGISTLDWSGPMDPALFDVSSAVDPATYWNYPHWVDTDPSLHLP